MMKRFSLILTAALAAFALSSCSEKPGAEDIPDGLYLKASATSILADGQQTVTLTLYYNGTDVSYDSAAEFHIIQDGTDYSYPSLIWSSNEICQVQFYAVYNGETSNTVSIEAVGAVSIPDDPEAMNYNFDKNTIILQVTGTGCGYCPYLIYAIEQYYGSQTNNHENAIHVSAHINVATTDPYTCTASRTVSSFFGYNSAPSGCVDFNKSYSLNSATTSSTLANRVRQALNVQAGCGIAAAVTADGSGTIHVSAKVKVADPDSYRIGAWLLEDGLVHSQANYVPDVITVGNIHNNVLRAANSTNPVYGQYVGGTPNCEAFSEHRFDCEFSSSSVSNVDNCHVVIFVTSTRGGNDWLVNNAVDCPVNGSVGYQYLD